MIFNKKDTVQKNWRMVKKGKNIVFGCMLFFTAGAVTVNPLTSVFNGTGKIYAQTGVSPEIVNDLAGKASTASVVTVKAQAGSTVKLYDANNMIIGEAVANAQGIATIYPTNSLPAGEITATSTPVGGVESSKSVPVLVTSETLNQEEGTVLKGGYNTQLMISKRKLTVYRGDSVQVNLQAAAKYLEKFWVANNPTVINGVLPKGGYLNTAGTSVITFRAAEYSGIVAMNQPLGDYTITFAAKGKRDKALESRHNPSSTVTANLTITVLELTKKYTPVLNSKVTVTDPSNVTQAEKEKIISLVKQENSNLPTGTSYRVDDKGNVTVIYPDNSEDKFSAAYAIQKRPVITTNLTDKALTKTPIEATAEPGSTVIIYDKDNNKIGEGIANAAGKVTITPTTNIPEGNVIAKAIDKRGSISDFSNPVIATKERVRPIINIPYDDPASQVIYVYSGEENNISLKITDNSGKIVKAYLTFARDDRTGLGDEDTAYLNGKTQSALYLKANSIHTETVATSANPAVINVTGNIPKGIYQEGAAITRYLFAEDAAGNTSYVNVGANLDAGAVGRIRFIWKPQTFKYDAKTPSRPSVVNAVPNATELTKTIKNANPTFSDKIENATLNGNKVVVTYKDGSTDMLNATEVFTIKVMNPAITPVVNINKLTELEKTKVKEAIKKANPAATDITVNNNGTATITFIGGSTATLESNKTVKSADANGIKDPAITPVQEPTNLTEEEKEAVKAEVKKVNDKVKEVEVGNDGTTKVTFNDGTVATLTPDKTIKEADSKGIKDPAITPVQEPTNLTEEEKEAVKAEVKKVNDKVKEVEVGNDGTTKVTFNDGTVATLTPDKTVKKATKDADGIVNPTKIPVENPSNLTQAEKDAVKKAIEDANPGKVANVVVGNDGTAIVTFNDGSEATLTPDKTVEKATKDADGIVNPAKTPVENPSNLTQPEKDAVKKAIEDANPGKVANVVVGNDGTATVTFKDGSEATLTPDKTVKKADSDPVKPEVPGTINIPGNKVSVDNTGSLTPEEIAKVKEEVGKVNPGKTVVVDAKGNATVTDPKTNLVLVIPAEELVKPKEQPKPTPTPTPVTPSDKFEVTVPTVKVPVVDAKNLTPAEQAAVKTKVEESNPGKTVVVDAKGNATVTDPNDPTATPAIIPGDNLVVETEKAEEAKPATPVVVNVPGNKVPVDNTGSLTPEEIAKVKEEVGKVNPGKTVVVDAKGNATVTDPTTGKVVVVPGASLVEQKVTPTPTPTPKQSESIVVPSLTIVMDPTNLTQSEKVKVENEVKKSNPTATKVEVGNDGTTVVTFKDGSTATLTPSQTIQKAVVETKIPKGTLSYSSIEEKSLNNDDNIKYKIKALEKEHGYLKVNQGSEIKGRLSSTGLNSTGSVALGFITLFTSIALVIKKRKEDK